MDPITWHDVFVGAGVIVGALIAFIVNSHMKVFGQHVKEDRENFVALFQGQASVKQEIGDGFLALTKTINSTHVDMLEKLAEKADK